MLISAHVSPDSDAIGSAFGLAALLKSAGLDVTVSLVDEIPSRNQSLLGTELAALFKREVVREQYDALAVVDTATDSRVSLCESLFQSFQGKTYVLDHHVSNHGWGAYNLIDVEAPATAVLIAELARELNIPLSGEVANVLYAGLLDDTGRFCYSNVNARSFRCAEQLLAAGLTVSKVSEALYYTQPLNLMKLQAKALNAVRMPAPGIAYLTMGTEDFAELGATADDAEDLIEIPRRIEGAQIAVSQKQAEEVWRLSFRSKSSRYDMNELAKKFGGGGHKAAAGCRMRGSRDEVEQRVISAILEMFESA